ncbi:hypothetical protein IFM89_033585 [Coptis chinensis]|uniref:Uncharacterized protein n=1 Tax=Coptis chinensis TaxID=261450 RepID=A0A835I5E4_9MAGN|nr:hypothetical protein IFM89_033585 [Coptis chinensis]
MGHQPKTFGLGFSTNKVGVVLTISGFTLIFALISIGLFVPFSPEQLTFITIRTGPEAKRSCKWNCYDWDVSLQRSWTGHRRFSGFLDTKAPGYFFPPRLPYDVLHHKCDSSDCIGNDI